MAISPQLPEHSRVLATESRLPFHVLSDQGNVVAESFGVVITLPQRLARVYAKVFNIDIPAYNGDNSWTLPMPSRFIVDQQGIIRAVDVNIDHTVRPEPASAISVVNVLGSE